MADRGPPLQFIPANGSSFCLLSNEYDKNTYARCGYVGNRTLLKCNEVRRKEELAKNNGICEIHIDFRNNIKETFQLEKLHLANDCPPKNVKKEKFYRSFHTDELALDENPFFTPVDAWFPRTVPNIYEKKVNNDIFSSGYDGVFSEKELLLMQIDIAKKELRELEAYQERHRSTAANLAKELNSEKSKTQKLSGIQAKHYMALLNYGKTSRDEKRIAFMANGPYPDLRKPCVFGMHEEEVIALTLCDIVGKVASDGQKNPVKPKCSGYALPRTEFCLQHIHTDSKVKFPFSKCVMCKNVVLFEGQNLCIVHQNTARGFMKSLKRRVVDTNSVVIDQDDMELFLKEKELEAKKERENAAKKARRTVVAPRNISFTSVSPAQHSASSMATHILSMYKGDEVKEEQPPKKRPAVLTFTSGMDAARCRPFTKEYFGKKETTASTRTTLPYGTPPVLPTTMVPLQRASTLATTIPGSSSDLSARVMNFPRPGLQQTYQTTRPKAAMPRMSQMDRIRNRMQQEEDQKAAASILDDRPDSLSASTAPEAAYRTGQYRVIRDNGIVKPRAPPNRANAAPRFTAGTSGIQQTIDINNLPDEMKHQSLGAVLKTGMKTGMTITSRGNVAGAGSAGQPRLLHQAPIRRAETFATSRGAPTPAPVSQRHQIAPVEVPTPSRQSMVPPHRLRPHAHAPAAPPPAAAPPRPGQQSQPRMIPLERQGPSVDMMGLSGSGKNTPIPPLEELLAQGRKSPAAVAKRPETPDSAKDLVRKRVKEQLPLPKFPATSRMRTTIPQPLPSYSSNRNPGQTGPRILQNHPPQRIQTLPNRIPAPSRAAPLSPLPVPPVSPAPNQRPPPSQIPSQSRGHLPVPPIPPAPRSNLPPQNSVMTTSSAPRLVPPPPAAAMTKMRALPSLPVPPIPPPPPPPSTSAAPSTSKAPVATEAPSRAKKPASRQGQRRSSRLSTSETKDSTDPLSLLADVSAAVSQPHEEDEYEEEL